MWKDVLTDMIINKKYQQFQTLTKTEKKELLEFVRSQIISMIETPGSNPSDVMEWAALVRALEPMMEANNAHPIPQVKSPHEGAHTSTATIRPFQNLSNTSFYQIREPEPAIKNIPAATTQFFLESIQDAISEAEENEIDNPDKKPIDTIEVSFDDPYGTKGKLLEQLAWDIFNFDRVGSDGLLMLRQYYEHRILCFQGVDFIQRVTQTVVNELAMLEENEEEEEEEITTATKFQPKNQPEWIRASSPPIMNKSHNNNNKDNDDNDDVNEYRGVSPSINP